MIMVKDFALFYMIKHFLEYCIVAAQIKSITF